MANTELTLEKFGSIGGGYFEALVALALDELGYVEDRTYVPSWRKRCVPGTWIEADFIISTRKDRTEDPVGNGRIVLAIGHATSENSAGMKFHRDVEQLLEVKALPNGDEYRVYDLLFCCPRETLGGWSEDLIAINEAIFDGSITIWYHDWGYGLLFHLQQHAKKLTEGTPEKKKERLQDLIKRDKTLEADFKQFKLALSSLLAQKVSQSRISTMFRLERAALSARLQQPLLITEPKETDFKRGLLQVLALHEWELDLLFENHQRNKTDRVSLEMIANSRGLQGGAFNVWWGRLKILSAKLGVCKEDYEDPADALTSEALRYFEASDQLAYVFDHFDVDALKSVSASASRVAPNLASYLIDLRDFSRAERVCEIIEGEGPKQFVSLCKSCFAEDPWEEMPMPRLLVLEVAKAGIKLVDKKYSYDQMASDSGNPVLVRHPFTMRFIGGKQGNINSDAAIAGLEGVAVRLAKLPKKFFSVRRDEILKRFVYERLDGMVKQPKESVLDALLDAEIRAFAKKFGACVENASVQGLPSVFNPLVGKKGAGVGVNVEIPYVLRRPDGRSIVVHRVNANDGHSADKRKEFSSKIRSIRYRTSKSGAIESNSDLVAAILVIDGNWVRTGTEDWQSHIRMLTVAGWDFVVFPDQLTLAFDQVQALVATSTTGERQRVRQR